MIFGNKYIMQKIYNLLKLIRFHRRNQDMDIVS